MNIAYNMDCMEAMKAMPDKCFDLAVVDPPYGIGESGAKAITRGKQACFGKSSRSNAKAYAREYKPFAGGDKEPPPIEYFQELQRVSKNQIIWGGNHFANRLPNPASSCWLVWDKQNDANDFADCELAYTSFKTAVRIFRFRWNGMLQGDMAHKEVRIHPTQKPVALYRWIFQHYSKPGDKILDTHLGSGSSRIAAYDAGLDFTGYEIDPDYFAKQEERFNAHTAQMSLFTA